MKAKTIEQTSTNRGEFNRAYKHYLEKKGKIHCSYCPYHRHENSCGKKYYGGFVRTNGHIKMTYPNWKLVSKNPKQWMEKPIKVITEHRIQHNTTYISIKFPA
jgi:hypothetical protein